MLVVPLVLPGSPKRLHWLQWGAVRCVLGACCCKSLIAVTYCFTSTLNW